MRGKRAALRLEIAEPPGACFRLEETGLNDHGGTPRTLRRLSFRLPARPATRIRLEGRIEPRR